MESISQNNVGPPTPRPALALSSNAAAFLHEGRVVAGEVLQSLPGGGVLVSIGGVRVPARAQVPLEPGQRFMATVETSGEVVLLRVHSGERASTAAPLLEALRQLLPSERSIGAVFNELAGLLKKSSGSGREGAPSELQSQLQEHAFQPGSKGAALAALLKRSGLGLEAALAWAGVGGGAVKSSALKEDLKARLLLARAATTDATLKDSLTKALRSIQSEQVKGLAREAGAEPRCVSLPFPDPGLQAGAWTTAWLTLDGGEEREDESAAAAGGPRLRLDLELAKLGQVSADLCVLSSGVSIRVLVASERAQALLEAALPSLESALGAAGLEVDVRVGIAPSESFTKPGDSSGVRFLREHNVLDESA